MKNRLSTIAIVCTALFVFFTGLTASVLAYFSSGFDPGKLNQSAVPTVVLDEAGQEAMKIQPPGPQDVPVTSIPQDLQHAVIAIEDVRFYQNSGVDLRSILRALWVDIVHRSALQGASTIPEQLAKVVYLNQNDKTLARKIKQMMYGVEIEKHFSKDEILGFYLNQIYLGHGATGVAEAAEVYFGKPAANLDLAECALLAGLPQAPSAYDPYVNKKVALERRNLVLQKMLEQNYITNAQYQAAINEQLALRPGALPSRQLAPELVYYRDYLYEEAERLGISASTLAGGGVTVYTSLNRQLQKAAYDCYQNPQYFAPDMAGQSVQSGAAFVNPRTGGLEAVIGSRGAYVERGLDRATQIRRSPGSAIKPLLVYGPAIQTGKYAGDSWLYDGDLNVNGYQPRDWSPHPTFGGKVTLREALAMSWNVPAVWLLQQIGIQTGIRFASKAGLEFTDADAQKLGIALGDITEGTNPLQMADAYSSFDNQGRRMEAHAIEKIVASDGTVIYSAHPAAVDVMDPHTASTMVGLLQNDVENGIAQPARVPGWGVAGKTGSTEFETQDRDVWFCGFTPTVAGAIWMGFDSTDAQHYIPNESGGSKKPAELFSAILQAGLTGPGQQFAVPADTGPVRKPEDEARLKKRDPNPFAGHGEHPGHGKERSQGNEDD